MTEEQATPPAARRSESRSLRAWLPAVLLVLVTVYALLFVVLNTHRVKVHFVFAAARVSVIWVILLSLAVGFVLGATLPRLYRRRKRRG